MPRFLMMSALLTAAPLAVAQPASGLTITCQATHGATIAAQLQGYLISNKMPPHLLTVEPTTSSAAIATLRIPQESTLQLRDSPYLRNTHPVERHHPTAGTILLTSTTEILAAMLTPGRSTALDLSGASGECDFSLLTEHLEIRQNITLWSQKLRWTFPDSTPAVWNPRYWHKGTPLKASVPATVQAFSDVFHNPHHYAIGCYTATKLVIAQAFLDYYQRVNPQPKKLAQVVRLLWSDNDPLVDIEPYDFWRFEAHHNHALPRSPGKLMQQIPVDSPQHFVPGDWSYFLNDHAPSYDRAGYEGSNALYLGGNRFDDYYADTPAQSYSFEQKIDEVYQWRHGVFSRTRHSHLLQPMTTPQLHQLARSPANGGLLVPFRLVPKIIR